MSTINPFTGKPLTLRGGHALAVVNGIVLGLIIVVLVWAVDKEPPDFLRLKDQARVEANV